MASPTCPFCNQPIRAGAKFCAKCGRTLIAPRVPSGNAVGVTCPQCYGPNRAGAKFCANCRAPLAAPSASQNVGVKCPQCGTLNRVGARFCAKCRSDLSARAPVVNVPRERAEKERGLSPNTWRIFAALGAGALVVLCLVGALAAYNARGKPTAVAGNPSPAPTAPPVATPITPILVGTVTPVLPVRWLTPQPPPALNLTAVPPTSAIEWANYANASGNYTLRHPTTWSGIDIGADAGFETPEDYSIEITADRATPGKSVADYARDLEWLGSSQVLGSTAMQIGEENALRLQIGERGSKEMSVVLYLIVHNNQLYLFTLRGATARSPGELDTTARLFDELVKSVRFTR